MPWGLGTSGQEEGDGAGDNGDLITSQSRTLIVQGYGLADEDTG